MNTAVEVHVTVHPEAIESIKQSEGTRGLVKRYADEAAISLRAGAPVRSGAGRQSITSTADRDFGYGWVGKATWDNAHYYMGIQNSRTHWADSAARGVRYV